MSAAASKIIQAQTKVISALVRYSIHFLFIGKEDGKSSNKAYKMDAAARYRARLKIYHIFMTSFGVFGTAFATERAK